MADEITLEQWLDEHRAEFQAKVDAADFWFKGEFPHYLATCNGNPTEDGFLAYLDVRLAADPEQKKRIDQGLICRALLAGDEDDAVDILSDAELVQRLGLKPCSPVPNRL